MALRFHPRSTPEKCKHISCVPKDMDVHNDRNMIQKQTASDTNVITRACEWMLLAPSYNTTQKWKSVNYSYPHMDKWGNETRCKRIQYWMTPFIQSSKTSKTHPWGERVGWWLPLGRRQQAQEGAAWLLSCLSSRLSQCYTGRLTLKTHPLHTSDLCDSLIR